MQVGMGVDLAGGGPRRRTVSAESSPRARCGQVRAIRTNLNASFLQRFIEFTANSSQTRMRQTASTDCKVIRATLQVDIDARLRYWGEIPRRWRQTSLR